MVLRVVETGTEMVLVDKSTVTNSNAWKFVKTTAGTIAILIPILGLLGTMAVTTFGEPFVNKLIDKKASPITKELQKTAKKVDNIEFFVKQIQLTLELSVADSIVEQVRKKTARFRPN